MSMKLEPKKGGEAPLAVQMIVNVVLPLVILLKFSDESSLGPTKALILALAFPVVFELYSVIKRRKVSMFSLLSIGGILVTGAISLLGLSEGWLAIRRSVIYIVIAVAIIVSIVIKRPLLGALLPQLADMEVVNKHVSARHKSAEFDRLIRNTGYAMAVLLVIIAILSYVVTRVVITSPTDTAQFNHEYARLRVLSLPLITLPLMAGFIGIIFYLVTRLEKVTGVDFEAIIKKKK